MGQFLNLLFYFKCQCIDQYKYKRNRACCQNIQKDFEKPTEFEKLNILNQKLVQENTR